MHNPNAVYGDFRNPNDPGSGGAAFFVDARGGNGGGLVRLVANELALDGLITANGGAGVCCGPGGSGGGIRIDVGTLRGVGQITANGGNATGFDGSDNEGSGGGGRVAIYYQSGTGFDLSKITAFGGLSSGTATHGGAGTVYLQGPTTGSGELLVDNNNRVVPSLSTPIINPPSGTIALTNLRVKRGGKIRLDSLLNLTNTLEVSGSAEYVSSKQTISDAINVTGNSLITQLSTTGAVAFKVDLSANTFTIDPTSRVDATARGFLGGRRSGNPFGGVAMTNGFQQGAAFTGGSYGGLGGRNNASSIPPGVYGDFRNPNEQGSGGESFFVDGQGGNGGGLIRIVANEMVLDGLIAANGGSAVCCASGGSGGGIRLDVGTLRGTGQIAANAGNAVGVNASDSHGGGSGGRVAIYYQTLAGFDLNRVSAFGGLASATGGTGGAGTAYFQGPARESGELVIDNNNLASATLSTPIPNPAGGTIALTNLRMKRAARIRIDSLLNLTSTLDVSSGSEFISTNRTIADTINVAGNSVISHLPTTANASFKIDLSAEALTIDATSRIDVSTRGFLGGRQPGNTVGSRGMTLGFQPGSNGQSGGSYGGLGGAGQFQIPNPVYGNLADPNNVGSGGAAAFDGAFGGNGGGLVRIVAQTLQLDGSILANGDTAVVDGGGGSGGGIRLDVGTLSGSGQIRANGGNGVGTQSGGGGGGGRIAVYYQNGVGFNFSNVTAAGGQGRPGGGPNGQNGTVHLQQQMAVLAPFEKAPVMNAEVDSTLGEPVGLAADLPHRRAFDFSTLHPRSSILESQQNLYLSMVAERKVKPFASTTAAASDVTGVSELTPHISSLTPDDLDPVYTYDLNGNRTSMIDPTGLTTYTYDALNRLTSITNNKGQVTSFTYDSLSRRSSMTHANGVVTSYTYDAASQLLTLGHQLGATSINSFTYTYDKVGNRKTKTSRDGLHDYTYDVLNRLTQAANPLPSNPLETFNYDPAGNRTNSNQNGSSVFNAANELNEDANFTYQYDNNGNMIQRTAKIGGGVTQYEYDAENKLVRVVSPTNTANYRYDGLGRRVEKEVIAGNTAVTKYVYDNEDILLELNGSNTIVARYTHGPGIDEPLITEKNNQSFYYHADGLSSITELTNQSGTVVQRYTYSSFGKVESQLDANFAQPYTYTSRENDTESQLYYYRMRTYDASIGRFLQEDPIGASGSVNLYAYVDGNPIVEIDPLGLDALDNLANLSAGVGDTISLGLTSWVRTKLEINDVIDECSWSYSIGKWLGRLHGIALGGAGLLNGGARTVLWSGGKVARAAAEAGKGTGKLLTDTPLGKVLDVVNDYVEIPLPVWKAASSVFAANAKGNVRVFLREPKAQGVWNSVEKPLLNIINRVHNAINGSPATRIIEL